VWVSSKLVASLGVENPELGGAWKEPLLRRHTKTEGPLLLPKKSSEAGKVAEILGPSIAIESTAGMSRFPLILIPRDPLCSSFVYLDSRRHPGGN